MKHVFLIALVAAVFVSHSLRAQTIMNIHQSNGTVLQLPISTIDSITYTINGGGTSGTMHTCGAADVHNPNLTYGIMTDQEGNVYKTIVIGTQEWMAENLNTSIYRNGDAIPTNLSDSEWSATSNGAWAYYNNDPSYACPYGKLYNWYTCEDARGLCPLGWHVPSDAEWTLITDYLGGLSIAGGKMKTYGIIEESTGFWFWPNAGATNTSGFSATPGGNRDVGGGFISYGLGVRWWSYSNSDVGPFARFLGISHDSYAAYLSDDFKQRGFSVRCLRD
jgi:uncharacterized protein (TIGR02145 family)